MIDILLNLLIMIIALGILFIWVYQFFKRIYSPYKQQQNSPGVLELLSILNTIIESEISAYENDIFQNKKGITNNNFDIYYKDICRKITKSLSPVMISQLSVFISEDLIYKIIARQVKAYLISKINY